MAMAPATESIMGSLPLAKASVGSAVNDATRTTGGALGVAVLGSLLSSGYRADMDGRRRRPARAGGRAARDSLAGALAVGGADGGGRALADDRAGGVRRRHARRGRWSPPAIALAGALIALVVLPARARGGAPSSHAEPVARVSGAGA